MILPTFSRPNFQTQFGQYKILYFSSSFILKQHITDKIGHFGTFPTLNYIFHYGKNHDLSSYPKDVWHRLEMEGGDYFVYVVGLGVGGRGVIDMQFLSI